MKQSLSTCGRAPFFAMLLLAAEACAHGTANPAPNEYFGKPDTRITQAHGLRSRETASDAPLPGRTDFAAIVCASNSCVLDFPALDLSERRVHVYGFRRKGPPSEGSLTEEGLATLRALHQTLASADLLPRYGCPGCTDGPYVRFLVRRNGSVHEHLHDARDPDASPHLLREAALVLDAVRVTVLACEASKWVESQANCTPLLAH